MITVLDNYKKVEENPEWKFVEKLMQERFDKEADLKAILFIIGLREFGKRKRKFTKEDKQDLMNLATCKVLSLSGYFEVSHLDAEGWPMWKQKKPMPKMKVSEQEEFIKSHVIQYFKEEELI